MESSTDLDARIRRVSLPPETVEFQFLFFYDLRARIRRPRMLPDGKLSNGFTVRSVSTSDLSTIYFSDNFPERLVRLHLHGSDTAVDVNGRVANVTHWVDRQRKTFRVATGRAGLPPRLFQFPNHPVGVDESIPSYSFLEASVFSNGIIALVMRVTNAEHIELQEVCDFIAHPEFPLDGSDTAPYLPGPGVEFATRAIAHVQTRLGACLDEVHLDGITVKEGRYARLKIMERRQGQDQARLSDDNSHLECSLDPSRPYVGTVVKFDNQGDEEVAQLLAIACARTTPPFLREFKEPRDYLEGEEPRRNIYYPGPSIVLIGRRGWACIMRGSQKPLAFQLGVVETSLFAIAALNGSVRAARRYIEEVLFQGQTKGQKLNQQLGRLTESRFKVLLQILRRRGGRWRDLRRRAALSNAIYDFTAFLGRARLNSPCDDVSSLVDSYLLTHTGIAAAGRIKRLTGHDGLIATARQTMAAYNTFLSTSADYWQQVTVNHGRWQILIAAFGVIATIAGIDYLRSLFGMAGSP